MDLAGVSIRTGEPQKTNLIGRASVAGCDWPRLLP